jgi:hypothetical protein
LLPNVPMTWGTMTGGVISATGTSESSLATKASLP